MTSFKHLYHDDLYGHSGQIGGCRYAYGKINQKGGAIGITGTDYPDPESIDYLNEEDTKMMIKYIKEMHKVLVNQPEENMKIDKHRNTIIDLLKEYEKVVENDWDPSDVNDLYMDWQYMFTDPIQSKQIMMPVKNKPKNKPIKAEGVPVIKKEQKVLTDNDRKKLIAKRATYGGMITGLLKQYQVLKEIKPETPQVTMKKDKLKKRILKLKTQYDYVDKRIRKHFPKMVEEDLRSKLEDCHKEVSDLKKELELRIKSDVPEIKAEPIEIPKFIVPKTIMKVKEKPVFIEEQYDEPDIDAELAKLEKLKKAIVTPSLNSYSIKELKAIAKKEQVAGISGLNKKQLIQLIINARTAKKVAPIAPPVSVKVSKKVTVTPVAVSNIDPLHKKTVLELKEMCKKMGITGYGHKSKEQIIASIIAKKGIVGSGSGMDDDDVDNVVSSIDEKPKPHKLSLIQHPWKDIVNEIKQRGKEFLFLLKKKKGILVAKGFSGKEVQQKLNEKINNNKEKYEGQKILRASIVFKRPPGFMVFGHLLIMIEEFIIKNSKLKRIYTEGMHGPIWFTKPWLELNKWSYDYLENIINKLASGQVKIGGIDANMYDLTFE